MIVVTNKETNEKQEISFEDFRKNFQKERDEQIKKDIIKALQKNYKKLSDSGHSVMAPSFYIDKIGLPDEYVFQFTRKHYSKYHDYKQTMFDQNNNILDYVFGVYNLEILIIILINKIKITFYRISFLNIKFWHSTGYLFYIIVL